MRGGLDHLTRPWFLAGQLACLAPLLPGCGSETRGWVLSEVSLPEGGTDVGPPRFGDAGADAAVDAGCPSCPRRIVLGGGVPTEEHGGKAAGENSDLCPDDQVLIGYYGTVRIFPASPADVTATSSLQGACGTLEVFGATVRIVPAGMLPVRGVPGSLASWSQACPVDQAIVAMSGRSGIALDQIGFVCAPWTLEASGALSPGSSTPIRPEGGNGGTPFQDGCAPGQIARGHLVRSGEWIDAFALVCGTPSLSPSDAGDVP